MAVAPGIPEMKISELPTVKKPEVWEFSAHPHAAIRAGQHIDMRLGNPKTGIAHSFVLPKSKVPKPGEMVQVIPTLDHTVPYMDFVGDLPPGYGHGKVTKGRRTKAEVYHADPSDEAGTKLRFNLYDEASPEEFSLRKDSKGKFFLHNKTQTRARRPDLPAMKPSYREIQVEDINPDDLNQILMPKLDGAHALIDLVAGRSPRVYSYREAKRAPTGLIEHTHKMPGLLERKVPKSLDGTSLRAEILAVDKDGKALPAQIIGGLLNSGVWKSRAAQEELGVRLKAFPFSVVRHKGRDMENAPFPEKLKVLREAERSLADVEVPEVAESPRAKKELVSSIGSGSHPLTEEGVVAVGKTQPRYTKAKFTPDFDVYVRKVHPAISGKTGEPHDRAGAISYSWTPDGPIVGQLGGFKHTEAKDMLKNPDKYVGRAAKVKAMKVFTGKEGTPGALFQPRFKEWHLDKGDIEKGASLSAFVDELVEMQKEAAEQEKRDEAEAKALAGAALTAAGMVGGLGMWGLKEALHVSLDNASRAALGPIESLAGKMGIEAPARAHIEGGEKFSYLPPSGVRGDVLRDLTSQGRSEAYIARAKRAGILVGPPKGRMGVAAHELGHAANAAKNKLLFSLAITSRKVPLIGMPGVGAVVGGIMAAAPEDANSWVVKAAPIMPVLFHAPVLADEALASIRGLKGMKALGTYSPQVLKKAKGNMIKAFGTYLLEAAALSAPVAGIAAARIATGNSKKKKTASSAMGRLLPSVFAHAYKDDEDFRRKVNKTVKKTLSTDPNLRRWQR